MNRLLGSWWFRIPFAYWLAGIVIYPPVYDQPDGGGYVRSRMWAWDFVGDDWNGFELFDLGTVVWQLCVLVTLVVLVRWIVGIVRRVFPGDRPAREKVD